MGNDDCCAVPGYAIQRRLHDLFAVDIDRTRRLVENQDRWLAYNASCYCKALPLPAAQGDSALADDRLIALIRMISTSLLLRIRKIKKIITAGSLWMKSCA